MKSTFILIIALMTSGSAMIPDQEVNKNDDLRQKRLILLEKLETGVYLGSEEIWSSFGERTETDFYLQTDFPLVISHYDIDYIRDSFRYELESLKEEINSLKNSDEFVKAMDEIRK